MASAYRHPKSASRIPPSGSRIPGSGSRMPRPGFLIPAGMYTPGTPGRWVQRGQDLDGTGTGDTSDATNVGEQMGWVVDINHDGGGNQARRIIERLATKDHLSASAQAAE